MTPALELQMCDGRGEGRGLDRTMAPSTYPIRDTLADGDLLLEPVILLAEQPGSRKSIMNSRFLLLSKTLR